MQQAPHVPSCIWGRLILVAQLGSLRSSWSRGLLVLLVPGAGCARKGLQKEAQGTCIAFLHPFSRHTLLQSDPPLHQQLHFPPLLVLETLNIAQYLPELRRNHSGGQRSIFANVCACRTSCVLVDAFSDVGGQSSNSCLWYHLLDQIWDAQWLISKGTPCEMWTCHIRLCLYNRKELKASPQETAWDKKETYRDSCTTCLRGARHISFAVVRVEAASRAWLIITDIVVESWCPTETVRARVYPTALVHDHRGIPCDLASDHVLFPFNYWSFVCHCMYWRHQTCNRNSTFPTPFPRLQATYHGAQRRHHSSEHLAGHRSAPMKAVPLPLAVWYIRTPAATWNIPCQPLPLQQWQNNSKSPWLLCDTRLLLIRFALLHFLHFTMDLYSALPEQDL